MEIQTSNNIRIPEHKTTGQLFRNIKPGATLFARVIERYADNEALIQINDRQFRAKFQGSMPASNMLTLLLNERKNGFLFFSLKEQGIKGSVIDRLIPFLAGPPPELSAAAYKYLRSSPSSLFDLNRLLYGENTKLPGEGLAALFNSIIKKTGSNPLWLKNLAYYLTENILQGALTYLIHAIAGDSEQERRRNRKQRNAERNNAEKIENNIKQITETIDNIMGKGFFEDEINALIKETLNLLTLSAEGFSTFELPFFDGHEFITLKCFSYNNQSWIFHTEFSSVGLIEIIAKTADSRFLLDIYAEDERLIKILERQKKEILLNINVPGIIMNVHNLKFFIKNILDLNRSLTYTGLFDTHA